MPGTEPQSHTAGKAIPCMPQGSKSAYTSKQKRMARHIEDSEKKQGRSAKTAARIGWATVNKKTGCCKKRRSSKRPSSRKRSRSH